MNDTQTPRDGELLSAYLTGDLGSDEVARLEARLAREPELAARLEATRAVVEGLARLDEVEPPPGFSDRLRTRLEAERSSADGAAAGAPAGAGSSPAAPASLESARERRTARLQQRWPALGAAAAAVAGVALLAAVALTDFGPSIEAPVAEDAAAPEVAEEEADLDALEAPDADTAPAPQRAPLSAPLLVESGEAIDDAEGARDHFADSPARELTGLPVEEAEDLAAAFAVAVRRAEPLGDVGEPGACLDAVVAGATQPVVPAHVEAVTHEDADAVAFVTVTAREDSAVLDRVETWVVEPVGCATRLYVELAE